MFVSILCETKENRFLFLFFYFKEGRRRLFITIVAINSNKDQIYVYFRFGVLDYNVREIENMYIVYTYKPFAPHFKQRSDFKESKTFDLHRHGMSKRKVSYM